MKKTMNILLGILCASIGVLFLKHAMIASGGTAGIALSASYLFGLSFSAMFFLINIPFYIFSFIQMGARFTVNSVISVSLLSFFTSLDRFLPAFILPLWVGAIGGGLLIGFGLAKMFINGSSLGGFNIMTLFFQKKFNIDPGKTNFGFDFIAIMTGFYAVGLVGGLFSVVTIIIISKTISYYKNEISGAKDPAPVKMAPLKEQIRAQNELSAAR